MKLVQWRAPHGGYGESGIRVPFVYGRPCMDPSPWNPNQPHSCTRNEGHTGRHAAYTVTGRVMGVWS